MMTDDLRQAVDLALKMARKDLEGPAKSVTPIFLLRDREGHIAQLPFPAEAARLMNYGEAKNAIFGYVREMIQSQGYTATVFATEAWYGKATEKGLKLDPKVLAEKGLKLDPKVLAEKCREPGFETAIREGLMERSEAVLVSVQTADRVWIVRQEFVRGKRGIRFAERDEQEFPQEGFMGRQKMFGDLRAENLR